MLKQSCSHAGHIKWPAAHAETAREEGALAFPGETLPGSYWREFLVQRFSYS